MPEKHSWSVAGGRAVWLTERLWRHRLAKAWLADATHIEAVRFPVDPDPDFILLNEPDGPLDAHAP